jgi:phage gp36-like protein
VRYIPTHVLPDGGYSYATVEDFVAISLTGDVAFDFGDAAITRHLAIASSRFDSALGQRYPTPMAYVSDAVVWCVCEVAYCQLMRLRGLEPGSEDERRVLARQEQAWDWVKAAQSHQITPDQRLISKYGESAVGVSSEPSRGW